MENALSFFSIYNLLVNLIPGTVLAFSLKFCVGIDLFTPFEHSWLLLLLLYFLGVLNSRISSLIFEPIIRGTKFVKVMPYENVTASELKDSSGKLTVLSRMNNEYRSYLSLFSIVLFIKLIFLSPCAKNLAMTNATWLIPVLGIGIFLVSYKKQSSYICSRITQQLNSQNGGLNYE